MSKNTLFIDGQVFQSAAWDRGMGKYSLEFIKWTFGKNEHQYEAIKIIFTTNMPLLPEAKKAIKNAVPTAEHIMADLPVPFDASLANVPELQKANQARLDALIRSYNVPDEQVDFLILSLFIDQVCTVFPKIGKKILLFYDLIPLQYNERYGMLTSYHNYLARFKTIFEADLILTISQTVADDVALNLGISATKIVNIDGAPIERSARVSKESGIAVGERFILMPSGNDIRKNNVRAVQGFEAYRKKNRQEDLKLVLTSTFDAATQHALETYSDGLLFTGNVSEEELVWLYAHAEALLFVPEYEGLGLPILEAVEVAKPIVCSNLTVFNEISPTAFYYSDPFDPFDIAEALGLALEGTEFSAKAREYPVILKKYTWTNTAKKAIKAIVEIAEATNQLVSKPKLAVLTPSPSGYSAIGKLVQQLHPALNEYFDIEYYAEEGMTHKELSRPDYLRYISTVYSAADFNRSKYTQYDAVLYHIGNSEFHVETIRAALHLPGYAIFHDTHLKNIFEGELLTHGYVTRSRLEAEEMLDQAIDNPKASYISSIVNNQLALIAHSLYTKDSLDKTSLQTEPNSFQLELPTATPERLQSKKVNSPISIGLAGIIHPAKGLDIIEEIAQSSDFYDCKIKIFGLSLVSDEVIHRLESYPNVEVTTNITDFQFQNLMSQLDMLINFRPEYRGETSLATIEAMRFGVIPIVRKVGWYDQLPKEAAVKVNDKKQLMAQLLELIRNDKKREIMKTAARSFVVKNHTYESYAQKLHQLITTEAAPNTSKKLAEAIKAGASLSQIKRLLS
jgi:glycosyltransferase involved in cell wall biosynthesis